MELQEYLGKDNSLLKKEVLNLISKRDYLSHLSELTMDELILESRDILYLAAVIDRENVKEAFRSKRSCCYAELKKRTGDDKKYIEIWQNLLN